jgi:hypothetical protein
LKKTDQTFYFKKRPKGKEKIDEKACSSWASVGKEKPKKWSLMQMETFKLMLKNSDSIINKFCGYKEKSLCNQDNSKGLTISLWYHNS